MAITFPPKYAAAATNKHWQKGKSLGDTILTKTNLGATLEAAEKQWNKIDFNCLDVRACGKVKSPDACDELKEAAQAELDGQVAKALVALKAAEAQADATTKLAGLSKQSKGAATAVKGELGVLIGYLEGIELSDFDTKRDRLEELYAAQLKKLAGDIKALESGLNKVEKTPTAAAWSAHLEQQFRSVANTLGNLPQFADFWAKWDERGMDGMQVDRRKPKKDEEAEVIAKFVADGKVYLKAVKKATAG